MAPSPSLAAIVGLGVNNLPLVPFLTAAGCRLVVADQKSTEAIQQLLDARGAGAVEHVYGGDGYLEDLARHPGVKTAFLTPGIRKDLPPLRRMAAAGVRLTCETDLFLSRCPARVVGITGSSGKTTTTTLVGETFRRLGPAFVGGNIGLPLLPLLSEMRADSRVVMELSSFQLELTEHSPAGALWLNLTPNHLDIHPDMDAYGAAKARILRFQRPEDWCVLPYGDDTVLRYARDYGGRRYYFGCDPDIPRGTFVSGGAIWWRDASGPDRPIMPVEAIRLKGRHNLLNVLAAAAAVALAGGDLKLFAEVVRTFSGVPHRLEAVGSHGGVRFVNDSIATTPERTLAALQALSDPIVLIAGGYDKHLDYDPLGRAVSASGVRAVVTLGATAAKVGDAVRRHGEVPVISAASLQEAVSMAYRQARPGDVVLLSPASASYDMFKNFEERGERFRRIVEDLK